MKAKIFNSSPLHSGAIRHDICIDGKVHMVCNGGDHADEETGNMVKTQNFGWLEPCNDSCEAKTMSLPPEVQSLVTQFLTGSKKEKKAAAETMLFYHDGKHQSVED